MKTRMKKVLSMFLAIVMMFSLFVPAYAAKADTEAPISVVVKSDKDTYKNFERMYFNTYVKNNTDETKDVKVRILHTSFIHTVAKELVFKDIAPNDENVKAFFATAYRHKLSEENYDKAFEILGGKISVTICKLMAFLAPNMECLTFKIGDSTGAIVYSYEDITAAKDCTVTFESNGGSAVEAVKVPKGTAVQAPEEPTNGELSFDGWYEDAELTQKYDFSKPVNSDITLYAKWKKADDFTDNESTEVGDKTYVLSADKEEIATGKSEAIVFRVNTALTITDGFELFCNGENTGIVLYDDGDFQSHHDDIPNDGCYTAIYYITAADDTVYNFNAVAKIGNEEIITNQVEISSISDITDAEIDYMDKVETDTANIVKTITTDNPSASKDALINAIRPQVDAYLDKEVKAGKIKDVKYSESGCCYSWVYAENGVENTLYIYQDKENPDFKEAQLRDANKFVKNYVNAKSVQGINYSKGKVIILNINDSNDSMSKAYNEAGKTLSNAGFTVTSYYNMKCSDLKELASYNSLILINSHGNTENTEPSGTPLICTNEKQTKENLKSYSKDIKEKRIKKVTLTTGEKVYWVYPKLFRDNYVGSNKLNDPIVYLGCCRQYPNQNDNNKMVDAIKAAGASTVCGYNASVTVSYDNKMIGTLSKELINGKDIDSAILKSKQTNGFKDEIKDDDWNKSAELNYYGKKDEKLYHSLKNGNFDSQDVGDNVKYWNDYGDSRVITKLSAIDPKSGSNMAIISSGFGANNNDTTSGIYQTVLVPKNAHYLEFSYDVVSEEPMEYVNSSFNDKFTAQILTTDGELQKELAMESVNTSKWYAVSGINFIGGDDTTYHTKWKTVKADISAYAGKLIVIQFLVNDAGDSIYDTAALLDSVSLKDSNGNNISSEADKDTPTNEISFYNVKFKFGADTFKKPSRTYSKDMASLTAALSNAVEEAHDKKTYGNNDNLNALYNALGIPASNRLTEYSTRLIVEKRFCRSVAHLNMVVNGLDTTILFISAAGSTKWNEFAGDAFTGVSTKVPFNKYGRVYDLAYEFYKDINKTVDKYVEQHRSDFKNHMKVVITGHSLGGAGANLVAGEVNCNDATVKWSKSVNTSNVYAYTYGSIDSFEIKDVKHSITDGFEYIHNIYNVRDTFGPNGIKIATAAGDSGIGRFGHMDAFDKSYLNPGEIELPTHVINHLMWNYMDAVSNNLIKCDHNRSTLPKI